MHIKYNQTTKLVVDDLISKGIHPVLAKIYSARNINNYGDINNSLESLPHPHTLKDTKVAASILALAIHQQNHITIVADYDCDGATACALGIKGLKLLAQKNIPIDFVVPNRFIHGYGLTPEIVDIVLEQNPQTKILMTVDNGISSFEGVEYARQKGLIVIITDHHLTSKQIPNADAVVNPNQSQCTFISKNIAGVGVMFYVLMATRIELRNNGYYKDNQEPKLNSLLGLVALGTVADVVKLDKINRCLVFNGLQQIKRNNLNLGLSSILNICNKKSNKISVFDLGFILGPRINAAGRIKDMSVGIQCLISEDNNFTQQAANTLNELNNQRKSIENDIKQDIDINLDYSALIGKNTLCLFGQEWHQGVIGIVASRLKEKYYLPTIIFASDEQDGLIKGSGRSIAGFHMRDAIDAVSKQCPHIITKFGGHAMAAGLTMHKQYFEEFCLVLEQYAKNNLDSSMLTKQINVDLELKEEEHTLELINLIDNQVWGQGFPAPLFANYFEIIEQKILKDQHLKLKLKLNKVIFDAIYFFYSTPVEISSKPYIIYEMSINTWNSSQSNQLIIKHKNI